MDKLMNSKFMRGLQAVGQKLGENKAINSIQSALMGSMGIIMVGAIFQICAVVPTNFGWFTTDSQIYTVLYGVYNLSMNMLSVWFVVQLGYNYAKALGLKPMTGAINATLCFLLTGTSGWMSSSMASLTTNWLGGTGLFVAILVGLVTVRIYNFCVTKNIVIKMPDVVPPFLADGFSSIIPLFFAVILWLAVSVIALNFTGVDFSSLFVGLISTPLSYLTGFWGMLVLGLLAGLMWTFGIHGTMMVYVAIMPSMLALVQQNAAAYQTGGIAALTYQPVLLFGLMACAGGTGNTVSLAFFGTRAKSEQLKAVGKASLIPGIFNINEPITFGYPIMYNPVMAIPYLINIVVPMILGHIAYSMKWIIPGYINIGSVMPIGVGEFLSTLNIGNSIFAIAMVFVTAAIYYPFFKAYDKQLYAKEQAEKAEEATAAK
jgi:PTS system cellobiose-specific IIC component